MKLNINRKNVLTLVLIVYLGVVIFFPVDQFNIKIITIFLATLLSIKSIFFGNNKINFITKMISIVFPFATIFVSVILTGDIINSLKSGYIPILFLWLPIIIVHDLNLKKYIMFFLKIEAIFICLIGLLDILEVINVNNGEIRDFIYYWQIGVIGKSVKYPFYYKLFLKTTPLLLFLLDDSFENKNYIMIVLTCVSLIFSGTRANIIVMIFYSLWRIIFYTEVDIKNKILLLLPFIIFILFNIPSIINSYFSIMNMEGSVSSDLVRSGQMKSYVEIFSNPFKLLIGTGLGSTFFNYGRNLVVSTAEYAYFDLLRQIGLIGFIPFTIFIIYPFLKNIKLNYKVCYLGYLIIAYTNPLLFSSTAFLVYVYIYYTYFANMKIQGVKK